MVSGHRVRRPFRILVEPSDFVLLNAGDSAMMQIALARLTAIWPDAVIQVLTDDPDQLAVYCPQVQPLLAAGRHAWIRSGESNPALDRRLLDRGKALFGSFRRKLRPIGDSSAKRLARLNTTSVTTAQSDAVNCYLEAVRRADLVIATGMGGITDTFPEYAFGLLRALDLAVNSGAMTAMVGQGMGPLERPDLVAIAERVLPKVDFMFLREGLYGLPLLKRLGVNPDRVVVTGDDAIELAHRRHPPVLGNCLGINLQARVILCSRPQRSRKIAHTNHERYRAPKVFPNLSARFSARGRIRFAVFRRPLGRRGDLSQSAAGINNSATTHRSDRRCRLVIVGSYHAAVFALAQGVSAIGLAGNAYYIQKFEGLADQFGAGCEVIKFHENGFEEKLKSTAVRMWNMADVVRPQLLARAVQQLVASKSAYESLSQRVNARFVRTPGRA